MLGKRTRSDSFPTAQDAARPAERLSIELHPLQKRRGSPLQNSAKRRATSVGARTPSLDSRSSPRTCRALSVDRSRPPLRLTRENLQSFEYSLQTPFESPMPPAAANGRNKSPTRNNSAVNVDAKKKLDAYNMRFDAGATLPPELRAHIERFRQEREGPVSPNAKAAVDKRRMATIANEATASKMMENHILFTGEGQGTNGGVAGLSLKDRPNLSRYFLPPPPRERVLQSWGKLSRPQPDSCIGYITDTDARTHVPALHRPFTSAESEIADWYHICLQADVHFPFLTAQWKSPPSSEGQFHAWCQSARDGATIVNYLHQFYETAYKRSPTVVETCHFSVTCDITSLILWVHWREVDDDGVQFRMEPIDTAMLFQLTDVIRVRKVLRNIVEFAMGDRLLSIKAALEPFWDNRPEKQKVRSIVEGEVEDGDETATTVSMSDYQFVQFRTPLTPSSIREGVDADEVGPKTKKVKV